MSSTSMARGMLAEALAMPADKLPEDARIGSVDGWDSLAHVRLILAIEQRIGRELESEEAAAIDSLDDIERLLARRSD